MRISDVAAAAGCSVRAIRHLHETGAVPEPPRTSGNYRDYSAADVVAVLRARALIDAGVAVSDIHAPDAVERSLELLDERIALLTRQRERLLALKHAPLGVPEDLKVTLKEVLGDTSYVRDELEALDLMAVTGVATPATWEQLGANLADPACVAAAREFAEIWEWLGSLREGDGAVEVGVEKLKSLMQETLMRGVAATLRPGDLPLLPTDLKLRGAQLTAMAALAGEFDA